jgi:trans-2,3-dihydro-3-hydroxyanthranilate isomerase
VTVSRQLDYVHVDVFGDRPYTGNSLAVFPDAPGLSVAQMLHITRELRHFEAIFLAPAPGATAIPTRVFDLFGELPFAGHPVLGAAAVLHPDLAHGERRTVAIELPARVVAVKLERTTAGPFGWLDQGIPEILGQASDPAAVARAFGLGARDLHPRLPLDVVSTGLRYLIVPLRPGVLPTAGVRHDLGELLAAIGAQFAVLFDEEALELRHWNNDGVLEDVATGSAAGTIGGYRLRHGLAVPGKAFRLRQGRFVGRPSTLHVRADGTPATPGPVHVGGHVSFVGHGTLESLP